MAMTFEEAEALLTPAQRDALARCALEDAPLPSPLSEAQRVFCIRRPRSPSYEGCAGGGFFTVVALLYLGTGAYQTRLCSKRGAPFSTMTTP